MNSALTMQRRRKKSNRRHASASRSQERTENKDESDTSGASLGKRLPGPDASLQSNTDKSPLPGGGQCSCRITTAVKQCWAASGYAALRSLDCQFENGVLFVHGIVSTFYYKQLAQETIRDVEGVDQIINDVVVKGSEELR